MDGTIATVQRLRWLVLGVSVLSAATAPGCSNFHGTTAASFLRNVRENPDPNVRFESYTKLGSPDCYDSDAQKTEAARTLIAKLEAGKEPTATRAVICQTLGAIGDPIARDAVFKAVEDPEGIVRAEACRALGRVGRPEDATTLTRIVALDQLLDCKIAALDGLASMKPNDIRVLQVLVEGMDNDSPAIRLGSLRALRRITGKDLGIEPGPWKEYVENLMRSPATANAIAAAAPPSETADVFGTLRSWKNLAIQNLLGKQPPSGSKPPASSVQPASQPDPATTTPPTSAQPAAQPAASPIQSPDGVQQVRNAWPASSVPPPAASVPPPAASVPPPAASVPPPAAAELSPTPVAPPSAPSMPPAIPTAQPAAPGTVGQPPAAATASHPRWGLGLFGLLGGRSANDAQSASGTPPTTGAPTWRSTSSPRTWSYGTYQPWGKQPAGGMSSSTAPRPPNGPDAAPAAPAPAQPAQQPAWGVGNSQATGVLGAPQPPGRDPASWGNSLAPPPAGSSPTP